MERRLILRGLLAGLVAGLIAFVFARIFAEPQIQAAIDYESGRDAALEALRVAAGGSPLPEGHDPFSRGVQSWPGIALGIVLLATVLGGMYAVVFSIAYGRVGRVSVRTLALLLAGAGFMTVYLVPSLKYPANPPSIGHAETIGPRTALYLTMVAASLLCAGLALWLGRRLRRRHSLWTSVLLAAGSFAVVMGALMLALPQTGELAANLATYGRQATETPQPLLGPDGSIVFPGFPADVLYRFRLYSFIAQVLTWGVIGLVFAPLAERLLVPDGRGERRAPDVTLSARV